MILVKHNFKTLNAPIYFALEEYVMKNLLKDDEVYFFTWQIKGIVIGKNQVLQNEVNLDYVKKHRIPIFRRPTGGGCVYADQNNTMFSIITKKNVDFSFEKYLKEVVDAINLLGLNVEYSGRNDLLLNGKKISGNAFRQTGDAMLIHGTLLYDCDIKTLVKSISPSDKKLVSKGIKSVSSRVVNLKPYLGGMTQQQLILHLENQLCDSEYTLTKSDVLQIEKIAEKYADSDYIFVKQPLYTIKKSKRFDWGLIEAFVTVVNGLIKDFSFNGDYFNLGDDKTIVNAFIGGKFDRKTISNILEKQNISDTIFKATNNDILSLLFDDK